MEKSDIKKVEREGLFFGENLVLISKEKVEIVDRETRQPSGQFFLKLGFGNGKQTFDITSSDKFDNLLVLYKPYNLGLNYGDDKKLKIASIEAVL